MLLTPLGPQSRLGDKILEIWLVCPQNGAAVLRSCLQWVSYGLIMQKTQQSVEEEDEIWSCRVEGVSVSNLGNYPHLSISEVACSLARVGFFSGVYFIRTWYLLLRLFYKYTFYCLSVYIYYLDSNYTREEVILSNLCHSIWAET